MKPSRKTITIQNRFITSIQSWLANASLGLLGISIFTVLSCKDDDSVLGFPKDPRLNTTYVEIPIKASVIRHGSILTQNTSIDTKDRIMVGTYNDPELGAIECRAFSSIIPPVNIPTPGAASVFDSLVLELRLDYYNYGSPDSSGQHIQIFEPEDTLNNFVTFRTNDATVDLLPPVLGEASFGVKPSDFAYLESFSNDADSTNDKVLKVYIKLQGHLGPDLLDDLKNNQQVFKDSLAFNQKYRGIGIVMASGDKVLGINPLHLDRYPYSTTKDTRLTLYYTDETGTPRQSYFLMADAFNSTYQKDYSAAHFTTITVDRTGTPLAGLGTLTDFVPSNGKVYVQGGMALLTKLDFTDFYNYMDTVPNAIFSSAELVLNNSSTLRPPSTMQLRVLNPDNNFRSGTIDSSDVKTIYFPPLTDPALKKPSDPYFADNSTAFVVQGAIVPGVDAVYDQGTSSLAVDLTTKAIAETFSTEFCQRLYYNKKHPRKAYLFALMANEDEYRKSVSSVTLDANIKLRIYYTKPVIKIQ